MCKILICIRVLFIHLSMIKHLMSSVPKVSDLTSECFKKRTRPLKVMLYYLERNHGNHHQRAHRPDHEI